MNKRRMLTLTIFAFSLFLSLTVFGKYRRSHGGNHTRLGVEITTDSNDTPLYLPVALNNEKNIVAYVPIKNGDYVSAVRVTPMMEDGKVKLEVAAVSGDYEANASCEELKKLPTRLVATRSAKNGETVSIQDDLSNAPWKVSVKAVNLRPAPLSDKRNLSGSMTNSFQGFPPQGSPCGCAQCGSQHPLWCCPELGKCIRCSNCGTVCCPEG